MPSALEVRTIWIQLGFFMYSMDQYAFNWLELEGYAEKYQYRIDET